MGRDQDMSKEELCLENERLSGEISRLQTGLEELQASLKAVDTDYQQSKASFTLARYGQLKNIVKKLISDDTLKRVHSLSDNQVESKAKEGGRGLAGLMQRAQEFAAQDVGPPKEPPAASKSGGSKLRGLFKRIKYATGFSEDPPDIRCMDKEDIRHDNERKRREIQRLTGRGLHALGAFQRLQERYQASKKLAPPSRYQELKDMIKDVMAEKI